MVSSYSLFSYALVLASAFATNHKGIPDAFTAGFDTDIGLRIRYAGSDEPIQNGEDLSQVDTAKVPDFFLGESSPVNTNANFIVLMVDPDVNGDPETVAPQTLHYLRTNFSPTGQGVSIASEEAPAVPYVGPEVTEGDAPHRYVFLLYRQPRNGFELKGVDPNQRAGFDVKKWREENGLEPAIAGIHFIATPNGAAASPEPITTVIDIDTSTTVLDQIQTTPCTTSTAVAEQPVLTTAHPIATPEPIETPEPVETAEPIETAPVGEVQTIIHTVTVTDPACACSDVAAAPTTTLAADLATSASPAPAAVTHSVIVGGPAGLVYTPEFVNAAVGDKVVFDFLSRNHTVTQSTLSLPCVLKADGTRSGFRANPDNVPGLETYELIVEDLEPKWYFCAQGNHCAQGMVFAINPGEKWTEFKENALSGSGNSTLPSGAAGAVSPTGSPIAEFLGAASSMKAASSLLFGLVPAVAIALLTL